MADFQIYPTRPTEAAEILAMTRETAVFSAEEIATLDELLRDYAQLGPEKSGYYFLSGAREGQVLGYVCYGPRAFTAGTYDIYWICAKAGAQGQGIGSALLRRAEQDIIALGGRLLIIETSTRPDYEPARRFYLAHRCRQEAVIEDFYHPGDGLVLFSKKINPPDHVISTNGRNP
jgi:ribosomal protein S18 acetylase RimI-like enzyme